MSFKQDKPLIHKFKISSIQGTEVFGKNLGFVLSALYAAELHTPRDQFNNQETLLVKLEGESIL